jgi:uncharacterized protein
VKKTIHYFKSVSRASTFKDKLFGLLDKKSSRYLLIKTRFGIHTFFLKEPIDVVILNYKLQIVNYKMELKPNKIFLWNPQYSQVLEMPKGTIKKHRLQKGDRIKFN